MQQQVAKKAVPILTGVVAIGALNGDKKSMLILTQKRGGGGGGLKLHII